MPLRHSNQQELLLQLEARHNLVYYAAPAFLRVQDLNEAFLSEHVVDRTAFLKPSSIGSLPDNEEHCVAFDVVGRHFRLYSEPTPIQGFAFGEDFVREVATRTRSLRPQPINDETFASLANDLKSVMSGKVEMTAEAANQLDTLPPIQRAIYISRTFFDCEILIVRDPEDIEREPQ